jgi:hypothetical protein
MSPRNQRKRFQALADQIRDGSTPLNKEQLAYLVDTFERIGLGEDANIVLGLTYGPGQSEKDEISLEQRSLILHWMTCAMISETATDKSGNFIGGLGLSFEQALDAVLSIADGSWINPKTKEKFNYKDYQGNIKSPFKKYSEDTLRRLWREGANKHMRTATQSSLAKNSPYPYK